MATVEKLDFKNIKSVYFIGIGGIGMSALARFFNEKGAKVSGYDKVETTLTKKLVGEGLKIHYKDDPKLIPSEIDLVVYTPAIPNDHLGKNWLLEKGYRLYKRAEILGLISRNYNTIAVAGTHGKTTTTSLVTQVLRSSGIDCTAFLGGISKSINGNYISGSSNWVVVEADEFDRSFLHLYPTIAVVMNMDADHLDIYGEHEALKNTFQAFVNQTETEGTVIYREGLGLQVLNEFTEVIRFGTEDAESLYKNIRVENGFFVFDFYTNKTEIKNIRLALAGRHNIENACAALTVGLQLGADPEMMKQGLAEFKGIHRRFEFIHRDEGLIYIDDYAHHPTELRAAIGAARELFPNQRITGIFQPHLFSRTKDFLDDFIAALDLLDEVFLLDIYPAREKPIPGINSKLIADQLGIKSQLLSKAELLNILSAWSGEILMTLGAGDIDQLVQPIKEIISKKK